MPTTKKRTPKALFAVYADAEPSASSSAPTVRRPSTRPALSSKANDAQELITSLKGKEKEQRWSGKQPFALASPSTTNEKIGSGWPRTELVKPLRSVGGSYSVKTIGKTAGKAVGKGGRSGRFEDGALADITRAHTGNGAFSYSPRTAPGESILGTPITASSHLASPTLPAIDLADPMLVLPLDAAEPETHSLTTRVERLQLV